MITVIDRIISVNHHSLVKSPNQNSVNWDKYSKAIGGKVVSPQEVILVWGVNS